MDVGQRYCLGCLRTLPEIAAWGSMSDEAQRALLAQLDERRTASQIKFGE